MALAEVDKAPFGWYHVRLAVVTGIGFFTDAYSVSSIIPARVETSAYNTPVICH
jgi:hypothetical protein